MKYPERVYHIENTKKLSMTIVIIIMINYVLESQCPGLGGRLK